MRGLILIAFLLGISFTGNGQALIGHSVEEIIEYHDNLHQPFTYKAYDSLDNDSLLVITTPHYTMFAFIDKETHYCALYTLIVDNDDWIEGYDKILAREYKEIRKGLYSTLDGRVQMEKVGYMEIRFDGIDYDGMVYSTRLMP